MTLGDLLVLHPVALDFLKAIGTRYWWCRGTPRTPWERLKDGVDCSGFVQMAIVRAGIYSSNQPDRRATMSTPTLPSLADICLPTPQPQFGDLAIYPGHVMFYLFGPFVIGASGGDSHTLGDNPKACVQLERFDYRHDFLTFGTLKPEHRLTPTGANP
jgi:cell wall-associated NlpC family hydrolase